jgi:hypothetical protein
MPNPHLAAEYAARSFAHYETARILVDADNEWAAVCYFYAAFDAARAALYDDVRLDSDAAARAAHPKLSASSRHVDFHNGHPSRGPGMNQIVDILYPSVGAKYELLHLKSCEVRYEFGLKDATIADICTLGEDVLAGLRVGSRK